MDTCYLVKTCLFYDPLGAIKKQISMWYIVCNLRTFGDHRRIFWEVLGAGAISKFEAPYREEGNNSLSWKALSALDEI